MRSRRQPQPKKALGELEEPDKLVGLHDVEVGKVSDKRLAFIDIYFGGQCQLDCLYCFTDRRKGRLTTSDRIEILVEAQKLGAKVFVSTGAGEPLLDPGFCDVILKSHSLGMTSVVYTNGQGINPKMARFLFENGVTPLIKLESLDAAVHDSITRKNGSWEKTVASIRNLLDTGFGQVRDRFTRIGVLAVYTSMNVAGLAELKDYCLRRGILLSVDELGLEKNALMNRKALVIKKRQADYLKKHLHILETGIVAPRDTDLSAPCLYAKHGMRIDQDGFASYCSMQDLGDMIGNVLDKGLEKCLELTRLAARIAERERSRLLSQINRALSDEGYGILIELPKNTCPSKAGDSLCIKEMDPDGQ